MASSILIAYFSHSGNTAKAARLIAEQTGGTLLAIQPEQPYPADYRAVVNQAKQEISSGYLPPLKGGVSTLDPYRIVFVGTPNWCGTVAPPVSAFLAQQQWAGKQVAPFCTHGGGGLGGVAKEVSRLCTGAAMLQSFSSYGGSASQEDIAAWLKRIGVKG